MSRGVQITPETRVAELLEAYPELEKVLVAAAPPFKKLRNPVLRRTIARVTSLERAADVAGISARDLVLRLREAAGLDADIGDLEGGSGEAEHAGDGPAPWVDAGRVKWTIDADALLETGTHPISDVLAKAATLGGEDLGLIRSSFRSAPLIEKLESRGFRTAVVRSGNSFATFVGLLQAG
jgi:hypothetical protein